jgi:hypothetical protein
MDAREPPYGQDGALAEYVLDGLWQAIDTSADFVVFALALRENWRRRGSEWTVKDLDGLLGAFVAIAEGYGPTVDGFDGGLWRNPWQILAMLLFNSRRWSDWMRATPPPHAIGPDVDEYEREGYFQLIETSADFAGFARSLRANWRHAPLSWTNSTLETYLGAVALSAERWGATLEATYEGPPCRPWKIVAALLYKSRIALAEPL